MPDLQTFDGPLRPGGDYDYLRVSGADLSEQSAEDARLIDCELVDCSADALRLDHARIVDTSFVRLSAVTLDARDVSAQGLTFAGCRIGTLIGHGSTWSNVRLVDGKYDYVNLRGAALDDVTLEDLVIGELDLSTARGRSLVVRSCRIGQLTVAGAQFEKLDLRGADLEAFTGLDGLAGATITRDQLVDLAPALATHLKITVQ